MKNAFKILILALLCFGCENTPSSFTLPQQNDAFSGAIFYNNKVDILFVVDNSNSMLQYQQRLSARVNDMITALNNLGMDYRVAVTTTTMSTNATNYPNARKLIGSPVYLTAGNIGQLANRIIVGDSGSDLERGLDAMKHVTSTNYLNSIGSDFIRDEALLSVIFISDEVDQSSEFGNPDSVDFVNYLNSRKPQFDSGARAWLANYIGILTNQSCDALGGHVSIGTQFIRLVDASNGVKSSICSGDLASAVSNIRSRIIDQITAYRFKSRPDKASIQVSVGGQTVVEDVVNGWTLETEVGGSGQTLYILKFHGSSIPAANEKVVVTFKNYGAS